MRDKKILALAAFVLASNRRNAIIELLYKHKAASPSAISKETHISRGNISNALREVKDKELVICINPEAYKGKVYCLTDLGEKVYKHLGDVII